MDITKYFSRKHSLEPPSTADQVEDDSEVHSEPPSKVQAIQLEDMEAQDISQPKGKSLSKATKKKMYKSHLSYRKEWEKTYSWVYCTDPEKGMFCRLCQNFGKTPVTARGAWTSRGINDWNHATELLKLHNNSKWHKDGAIAARMAEQAASTGNAVDLALVTGYS